MFTFEIRASHVQLMEAAAVAAGQVAPGFGGGASSGASSSAPAVGGTAPTTPALKRPHPLDPPPGLGPPASASTSSLQQLLDDRIKVSTAQAHKAWGKVQVQRSSGLWEELPPAPRRPPPGVPAAVQGFLRAFSALDLACHMPNGYPGKVQAPAEHQRKQHQPLAVQQAAPAPAGRPAGGDTAPAKAAPVQAAPASAVGGTAPHSVFVPSGIPVGPAHSWSINGMVTYLDAIDLGHLNHIFRDYALDGAWFLLCAQEDLQAIGIGQLQQKKIKTYMPE